MHHSGKPPIDGGYKTPEVEIVNLSMLNFVESPCDHRPFVFDISTRSLLGVYRYKVCWPVSRHLVTLLQSSVQKCNKGAVQKTSHSRNNERGRQYDQVLWVSVTTMVGFNDHQFIETDGRDQNPFRKELQEDSAAAQCLQPNNSNLL